MPCPRVKVIISRGVPQHGLAVGSLAVTISTPDSDPPHSPECNQLAAVVTCSDQVWAGGLSCLSSGQRGGWSVEWHSRLEMGALAGS